MLVDHALQYAGRGWRVFPVHSTASGACSCGRPCGKEAGKHPRIKAWQKNATTDVTQILAWWSKWPDANIGLATGQGLVVLDLDGAEEAQRFVSIAARHGGLAPTLTAMTGRGFHVYLAGDVTPFTTGKVDGLLVRGDGGYVIAPPSLHASGKHYQWVRDVPLAPLSDWFRTWVQTTDSKGLTAQKPSTPLGPRPSFLGAEKPRFQAPFLQEEQEVEENTSSTAKAAEALRVPYSTHEQKRVESALSAIPASCARDPWLHVGMALHSLNWVREDGGNIGLMIWNAWSSTCAEKYSLADIDTRWKSFGKPGRGGITIGTLYHLAEQHGWKGLAAPAAPGSANGHALNGHAFPIMAQPEGNDSPLIELNQKYACIGDIGGKCLVLGFVPSKVDETIRVPSFQNFQSFTQRFANQYVMVSKKKGDGFEESPAQLGAEWLKWKQRRSFEGIDLVPNAPTILPSNMLNLWCGFAVKPQHGDWSRMKGHIAEVLADGDATALDYIMRFAAWAVQNPGERAEVALVFRGDKGSGKGTFAHAMRNLFGQHGLHISNSKHLVGAFNAHLRNCLWLFSDEAFWAGDKQGESVLKALITEPVLMIEQKGIDATQWRNRVHMIMAANNDWVVPASHDERRFAMFNVNNKHAKSEKYFKALYAEMQAGGLAAMLHDLLNAKLGDWHPRRVPNTQALREQKARSMTSLHEWYESLLQDAMIPSASKDSPDIAPAQFLLQVARDSHPRMRDTNSTMLGRFLGQMGCIKLHRSSGNAWRFPPVAEARSIWEKHFSGWDWELPANEWRIRS